jgi:hypothetical protein
MSGFTLHTSARADVQPAIRIIYEGVNELVQEGTFPHGGLTLGVKPDDEVIYAASGPGDLIGVLCFSVGVEWLTISLAYVEPSSRRMGVFNAMWDQLLKRLDTKPTPPPTIRVLVHHDNSLGLLLASKLKMLPQTTDFMVAIR